jgi:hypothetical protein
VKELPSGGLSEIVISIGVPFSILSKFYRVLIPFSCIATNVDVCYTHSKRLTWISTHIILFHTQWAGPKQTQKQKSGFSGKRTYSIFQVRLGSNEYGVYLRQRVCT